MKTRFSKKDFTDLKYNVFLPEDIKITEFYSNISKYPEFKAKFEYDKDGVKIDITENVHRYMFLLYQESVLNTLKTLSERKREAAVLVGLNDGDKFPPYVENILLNKNPDAINVLIRVCKIIHHSEYLNVIIYEETLDNLRRILPSLSINRTDKLDKIIKNIDTLSEKVSDLTRKILNNNIEEVTLESLYKNIDYDILGIIPEEIADAIEKGSIMNVIPPPQGTYNNTVLDDLK